mgnify:CR=1 FL=1
MTFVDISVSMDQSAFAICFIFAPIAFVSASIDPYLYTLAISLIFLLIPLAYVFGTVLQNEDRPLLPLDFVFYFLIEYEWA